MEKSVKVCVTGGAGYLASFLIKHLLQRGYTVHATLRSLRDASKVGLLKGLGDAETRLKLIYNNQSWMRLVGLLPISPIKCTLVEDMRGERSGEVQWERDTSGEPSLWAVGRLSSSMAVLISQAKAMNDNGTNLYKGLRSLEELMSKVPIAHTHDVIQAHIFSIENSSINGRFLVANAFFKSSQIASLIHKYLPDITIPPQMIEDTKRDTKWGSRKLEDLGFQYKFDADKIIDDSVVCAKRLGDIV